MLDPMRREPTTAEWRRDRASALMEEIRAARDGAVEAFRLAAAAFAEVEKEHAAGRRAEEATQLLLQRNRAVREAAAKVQRLAGELHRLHEEERRSRLVAEPAAVPRPARPRMAPEKQDRSRPQPGRPGD